MMTSNYKTALGRCVSVLILIMMWSVSVHAKDICLSDGANNYVLSKVKLPKPGKAVTISGLYFNNTFQAPITGSISRNGAGTVYYIGVFVHAMQFGPNDLTATWVTGSALLDGTGVVDTNGDFVADVLPIVFTSVDCHTITIP